MLSVLAKTTISVENVTCVGLDSTVSQIATPVLVTELVPEVVAVMLKLVSVSVNLVSLDVIVVNVQWDTMVSLSVHYVNVRLMDVLKTSVTIRLVSVSVNQTFKGQSVTYVFLDITNTLFVMHVVVSFLEQPILVVMTMVSVYANVALLD